MDFDRHEDSGEMYPPDDQGEYTSLDKALQFSMQGLSDTLTDVGEGMDETPAEYTMMLEVTMADHLGQPCPPTFWNVGMVMHVLKRIWFLGSWNMCKWTAQAPPSCSFMTSRTVRA